MGSDPFVARHYFSPPFTTSQRPPLRPPILRILPADLSCARFFSTPLTDKTTYAAKLSRDISGNSPSNFIPHFLPHLFPHSSRPPSARTEIIPHLAPSAFRLSLASPFVQPRPRLLCFICVCAVVFALFSFLRNSVISALFGNCN